jgi:hypothetical protein
MKLWWLKRKLKSRYVRYRTIADEFSCGNAISEYVSSRLRAAKYDVNAVIRKLRKIDPDKAPNEIP